MKNPWVRREELDRLTALLDQAAVVLDRERERYAALVAQMAAMMRVGFHAPVPPPAVPPPADELPIEVQVALEARVNPRSPVGRQLTRQAMIWLAGGKEPGWVADQILRGAE